MSIHRFRTHTKTDKDNGQALTEYALILVLVAVALGVALAATGPAIGNVFSNQIFNLLGEDGDAITGDILNEGAPQAFWETVTAVAQNPPNETPFPTNPPVTPPPTATDGPTLTPSPTIPTATPPPSQTPPPSPTPPDIIHDAPFEDPVDNPEWYRLESSIFTGYDLWTAEFFPNTELAGSPVSQSFDPVSIIDFDWGSTGPISGWPGGSPGQDFSIRFERDLNLSQDTIIKFSTTANDGVRLWLDYSAGCAGAVPSGGPSTGTNATFASGCLLVDNWQDQSPNTNTITRTVPAGSHTLRLDYYQGGGTSVIGLEMESGGGNVTDDAILDNSYNVVSNGADCTWGQRNDISERPNGLSNMWEENLNNDFPTNMRCHLELRGAVDLTNLTTPRLAFWDVWDLGASDGVHTKLQLAHYDPLDLIAPVDWSTAITIDLQNGSSANYGWTHHEVDINALGFTPADHITYRFMIESNNLNGRRVWWIDDIYIYDASMTERQFSYCQIDLATCSASSTRGWWDLDDIGQRDDFIASGRWGITSNLSKSGMAFDDSPGTGYDRSDSSQNTDRIHSVEFAGLINLTDIAADGSGGVPDAEGDTGFPQISFWQAYDLDRGELIRLEYTFDPRDTVLDNWNVVAGAEFVPDDNQIHQQLSMGFMEIPLNTIPGWDTTPFRLRYAMYVDDANTARDGWWIDEIHINRIGLPDYAPYPFCDGAENGSSEWLLGGSWNRTTTSFRPNNADPGHSFTDSPGGDYRHNSNDSMELRYVLDLNNDTQENFDLYGGNEDNCAGGAGTAATNPMLSFYHTRALAQNDHIYVDWSNNDGQSWTQLWRYQYNSNDDDQLAWERVEIDLSTLQNGTAGGPEDDDDVLIRIRLDARSDSRVSDGIYIDDIRIEDRVEVAHKLWPTSRNDPTYGTGDGRTFVDDIDTPPDWWNRWYLGGGWTTVDYSVHSGNQAFHDSPPQGTNLPEFALQILELQTIIDLSAVDATTDRPIMYFWGHYEAGDDDRLEVEIAPEDTSETNQNYDQLWGWDNWENTNFDLYTGGGILRSDTWQRYQVDLRPYAGKRIRVRFVSSTIVDDPDNASDGLYIDDVRFTFYNPRIFALPFSDPASNTDNWVTEGLWGLDVEKFRGSGGGPAALGFNPYFGFFIDCPSTCDANGTDALLDSIPVGSEASYVGSEMVTEVVLDINHNFGTGGRPAGSSPAMTNNYVARWRRDITVQDGDFTFITRSDDGVRVKVDAPIGPAEGALPGEWNIYEDWTAHAPTTAEATVHLPAGNWLLVVEWFEQTGGATIIMSVGKNNFSFSDSPKLTLGPGIVPVVPFGNSSLILDGVLDLTAPGLRTDSTGPRFFYYEYRDHDDEDGRFEVSSNGGFGWTQSNLDPDGSTDNPNAGGGEWLPPNPWLEQQHALWSYVGSFITVRFRQDAMGEPASDVDDGWWVVDILVNQ